MTPEEERALIAHALTAQWRRALVPVVPVPVVEERSGCDKEPWVDMDDIVSVSDAIRYVATTDLTNYLRYVDYRCVCTPMLRRWPWSRPTVAPRGRPPRELQYLDDHHVIARCPDCNAVLECIQFETR